MTGRQLLLSGAGLYHHAATRLSGFSRLSGGVRGAMLMIGSCATLAGLVTTVRFVSAELDPIQIAFFRNVIGIVFLAPWLLRAGLDGLRTERLGLHLFRALVGLAALILLFMAVKLMPLAEATALTFAAPLFAIAGSALILGEVVGKRRWIATVVGFAGTMIILKPGAEAFRPAAVVALASALCIAAAILAVKSLSRTERPTSIVLFFNLLVTPLSFVLALFVWETPAAHLWKWLVLIGFLATASQLLLTQALAAADASQVLPFDFSQLVFVAILGFLFYAEVPSPSTCLGSILIVGATAYVLRRSGKTDTTQTQARGEAESVR